MITTAQNSDLFAACIGVTVTAKAASIPINAAFSRDQATDANEDADLVGAYVLCELRDDGRTHTLGLIRLAGEGPDVGRRVFEDRPDATSLVFKTVHVAQHGRQEAIGGLPDLLRGAIADRVGPLAKPARSWR